MTDYPLVSIIVRTKNEERWIGACLRAICKQSYTNFEIILVDNGSTDQTIAKAMPYGVKLVTIDVFLPGKAINDGIRASQGEILVCLSGHCIPVDSTWLENLVKELKDPAVAGVYGRQQPMSFSSPFDKRDLMLVFGLDRKVQYRDSFFHNANSAFRRDVWNAYPFDEEVTNIEDRVLGKKVISEGYQIVYSPDASVYHYHGIHQDLNRDRAAKVVRIMEEIEGDSHIGRHDLTEFDVTAIIPVRGPLNGPGTQRLLDHTLSHALGCRNITRVVVSTDDPEIAAFAEARGAQAPFLRPPELSEGYVDITEVLQFSLDKVEDHFGVCDAVVVMLTTHPFRPPGMIDAMIERMIEEGLDTVVAVRPEMRQLWLQKDGEIEPVGDIRFMPRHIKESHAILGLFGLGCVTHPVFIRETSPFGPRLGVYEIDDPFASVEIRDSNYAEVVLQLLDDWQAIRERDQGANPGVSDLRKD